MAAKKTTTKSAPAPAKKAAKKVAKKAVTKVAKKAPAKKAAAKKATKKAAAAPKASFDDIAKAAYLIYRQRVEHGLSGDSHSDWIEAERQTKA